MDAKTIRLHLLRQGVKNLKAFGYPQVNEENILKDRIYSAFFKEMLKDNVGQVAAADLVISDLLAELSKESE